MLRLTSGGSAWSVYLEGTRSHNDMQTYLASLYARQCLTLFAKDHVAKIRGEFQDLYYDIYLLLIIIYT